jgi:pyrroline-5-carboxylate reductase
MNVSIAFIGGGNMAGAILGGLLRSGHDPARLSVLEPDEGQRERLRQRMGVALHAQAGEWLAQAELVVWAVKPQMFAAAAAPCAPWIGKALQLSVMAGVPCSAVARSSGSGRVVRAMPNTPALIGEGIAGLYAGPSVMAAEREQVEHLLAPTGALLWLDREADLDAVTALSGSGPAYFFYLVEAMMAAGVAMGLSEAQARQLAFVTCKGAAVQGLKSDEAPAVLRERVTSKGGTTHAAISSLEADGVGASLQRAVKAAQQRARELGDEFGS